MTDITETSTPRDARYHVKCAKDIGVIVKTDIGGTRTSVKAELVDISSGGARLRVREPIASKEIVGLELKVKRPRRKISISGEVCWMVPATGDCWWIGCAFSPAIPEETLEEFAAGGVLERRQFERESVQISTVAKWELDSESASVQILNYSQGGFCLRSKERGKPGERLLVQFRLEDDREVFVRAKAQWQVEERGGFIIGCEFLDPADCALLNEIKQNDESAGANSFSVWQWLGGA